MVVLNVPPANVPPPSGPRTQTHAHVSRNAARRGFLLASQRSKPELWPLTSAGLAPSPLPCLLEFTPVDSIRGKGDVMSKRRRAQEVQRQDNSDKCLHGLLLGKGDNVSGAWKTCESDGESLCICSFGAFCFERRMELQGSAGNRRRSGLGKSKKQHVHFLLKSGLSWIFFLKCSQS